MTIHALHLGYADGHSWIVLSPTGKIRAMGHTEFLRQLARPHSLEYEMKTISYDNAVLSSVSDAFQYLLDKINFNIKDICESDIVNFYQVWGAALSY